MFASVSPIIRATAIMFDNIFAVNFYVNIIDITTENYRIKFAFANLFNLWNAVVFEVTVTTLDNFCVNKFFKIFQRHFINIL